MLSNWTDQDNCSIETVVFEKRVIMNAMTTSSQISCRKLTQKHFFLKYLIVKNSNCADVGASNGCH